VTLRYIFGGSNLGIVDYFLYCVYLLFVLPQLLCGGSSVLRIVPVQKGMSVELSVANLWPLSKMHSRHLSLTEEAILFQMSWESNASETDILMSGECRFGK
jgi:hypothetical protein